MQTIFYELSRWAIPGFIFFILLYAAFQKVRIYEAFVEGAQEGIKIVVK